MIKREPLMSEQYFVQRIDQISSFIEQTKQDLKLPEGEVYLDAVYHDLYLDNCKLLTAQYSAGVEVSKLTETLCQAIEALVNYKAHPDATNLFFIGSVDEYMNVLAMLTWGITLPIEQNQFAQLVQCIDQENKRDALIDMLIAHRISDRKISQDIYLPKLYTPLYKAALNKSDKQMADFLAQWYSVCVKKTANYEIYTLHGGDDSGFNGYWAWEVAGMTYALGIDDSVYQSFRYYPTDLVRFARHQ
ncbi:PoNe immunity protein domain-containing protein [Fibrella sp. WM1]|uniref:PoNe immunity protein domain-containing protein n=1 Tax=Fibrella musci TaxID=3242485 RepID=UPI0035200482